MTDDSPDIYKRIVDTLDEGVYLVDLDRKITYWNAGAERLTGYSADEVLGRACCDDMLQHISDRESNMCSGACPIMRAVSGGESSSTEVYLRHKAGHRVPVRVRVMPVRSENGDLAGAVQTFSDNRATLAARTRIAKLEQETLVDALTGLGNRRAADQELAHRTHELARYGWDFGVIFVDVDNFKAVNDTWGHEVGDEVLKMVARDLIVDTRDTDHVCRWGGEEFLVIALNVDEPRLQYIANKLRYLVEQSGFERDGQQVRVTVSAGATMAISGESPGELISRVDALMYHSKQTGRNRVSTRLPDGVSKK
jgi:diguanylate cyclase (GGDEF)-like protein/PAS domain S-box-containing protein